MKSFKRIVSNVLACVVIASSLLFVFSCDGPVKPLVEEDPFKPNPSWPTLLAPVADPAGGQQASNQLITLSQDPSDPVRDADIYFYIGSSSEPIPDLKKLTVASYLYNPVTNPAVLSGINNAQKKLWAVAIKANCNPSEILEVSYKINTAMTPTTPPSPPVFTTHPVDKVQLVGASVMFTVVASGNPSPTYQWQISTNSGATWNPISGSVAAVLSLTVQASMDGNKYRCIATNNRGSATSSEATLRIPAAPAITTQPTSQTANVGGIVTFTVAASGVPTPTYQWKVSTDSGTSWADMPGATESTLTLTAVALMDGNKYRCVATNSQSTATSNTVTLTVQDPPMFTTQPTSEIVTEGETVTFTVAVSGTPAPTLKWQTNASGGWADITGETSETLTLTNVEGTNNGHKYRCVATNVYGSATSTEVTLTVLFAPRFATHPAAIAVAPGGTATFTVVALGNPEPALQWQTNASGSWADMPDETNATLRLTGITAETSGNQYRCLASNSQGDATSGAATLTVGAAVAINTHPASQNVVAGGTATFTVSASGDPAPTYKWQVSTNSGSTWTDVTGATSATLTLTNVQTATHNGNQYRCVVSNGGTPVNSNVATLKVGAAPLIETQPVDRTVTAGTNSTTFSVTARGATPLTYKWSYSTDGSSWSELSNTGIYTNTGTATMTLTNATAAYNNYKYRCLVTNDFGNVTSDAKTLTVQWKPSFTTDLASAATVIAGTTETYTIAVSSNPAPTTYQWETDASGSWANVPTSAPYSGGTTAALKLTDIPTTLNGKQFRCKVTNSVGNTTSSTMTLTVQWVPAFGTQPTDKNVVSGTSPSFTVAASGNPAPAYKWQLLSGSTWGDINGATSATLTLTNVTPAMSGNQYRCMATNAAGSTASSTATLTVGTAPAITTQPGNQSVPANSPATFTVEASGTPTLTYQWEVKAGSSNWATVTGATSETLTLASVTSAMNGNQYRCVVKNDYTTAGVTSNAATLTVTAALAAPEITTQPTNQTVVVGASPAFTVVATGNPAPTYKWQISTNSGSTWSDVSGGTSATLTLTSVTLAMSGNKYRCVVSNSQGTVTSNTATLTVGTAPSITAQPTNQIFVVGEGAQFTVTANGSGTLNYQWWYSTNGISWSQLSNTGIYSATSTRALGLTNVTSSYNNYKYRCVVTNDFGSITSNTATLTMFVAFDITTQPANQNVARGGTATFTVETTGNPAPTYQWRGTTAGGNVYDNIAGATSATLTLTNVQLSQNGTKYMCSITQDKGGGSTVTGTSNSATLMVSTPATAVPLITTQPQGAIWASKTGASFTVVASGGGLSYQWRYCSTLNGTYQDVTASAPAGGYCSDYDTDTLFISGVGKPSSLANYYFRCVVTNSLGTATSNAARLTVQ